jgi:hypothetical protein
VSTRAATVSKVRHARITDPGQLIPSDRALINQITEADRTLAEAQDGLRDAVRSALTAGLSFRDLEACTRYTRSSLSRLAGNRG